MHSLLVDVENNAPREEAAFRKVEDDKIRDRCNFKKVCDFVFSDADKDWYKNYFIALAPKLEVGGCFTAHNASNSGMEGIRKFLDYVKGVPNFKTTIDTTGRAGISISYKIAEN